MFLFIARLRNRIPTTGIIEKFNLAGTRPVTALCLVKGQIL